MISTAAVAEAGKVSKQRGPRRAAGWARGCLEQDPWLLMEKGLGSPPGRPAGGRSSVLRKSRGRWG